LEIQNENECNAGAGKEIIWNRFFGQELLTGKGWFTFHLEFPGK